MGSPSFRVAVQREFGKARKVLLGVESDLIAYSYVERAVHCPIVALASQVELSFVVLPDQGGLRAPLVVSEDHAWHVSVNHSKED
jgi:hypothetical protein